MNGRASGARRGLPPAATGVAVPADRRFRRSAVRPGKRRSWPDTARRVTRVLTIALLVLGPLAWAAHAMFGSTLLQIDHVVVRGTARLSTSQVESLLAGIRGEHLLRVDLEQYRRRVLDSPWVATASLWRVLPSTVEVRITERMPMAIARLAHQLYLVDQEGVIIDEFGPQYVEFDLPIVDGLIRKDDSAAALIDPVRASLTGRALAEIGGHPGLSGRVSQINVSNPHDVVVLLDDDPARLHLGEGQFVERLLRYLEMGPALREQLSDLDDVDLRFDEQLFVRPRARATSLKK